ncbi:unnamed protein product [Meganyctiphanes norvegica]|uniref:Uncharacterized protein n=1 Tax=Meganyctiphanes norvegica TaxID=48144 RepID=A0AAV2R5J8_MEGNR
MSKSIIKEEFDVNFPSPISFYNNRNINKSNIVDIKHNNENVTYPEEGYLHRVLPNSTYAKIEVNVNEESDGSEEQIKDKEEIEIKDEPMQIDDDEINLNHRRTHSEEKP